MRIKYLLPFIILWPSLAMAAMVNPTPPAGGTVVYFQSNDGTTLEAVTPLNPLPTTGGGGGGGGSGCAANVTTTPVTSVCPMGYAIGGVLAAAVGDSNGLWVNVKQSVLPSGAATDAELALILTQLQGTLTVSGTVSTRVAVTPTDKGSTIATGGTAQTAIASNGSRKGGWVQNPCNATEDLYVSTSGSAVTTAGTPDDADLPPCGSFSLVQNGNVITAAVSVNAVTTAHAFIAKETQ